MDVAALAYAAGIIDGEGTIGVTELAVDYEPGNRKRRRKSPQFRCYVAVVMSDPTVPMWLRSTFGGYLYTYAPRQPNHKPPTRWCLANGGATSFCIQVQPFLRLKKEQASLLIDFWHTRIAPENRRALGLTDDEIARRRLTVARIHELNKRGVA